MISFSFCLPLEFVCRVGAEQELKLEPKRVIGADSLAVVVVVLHSDLRELARIPREVRRQPRPIAAQLRYECSRVAACELPSQTRHDAGLDPPQHLGVRATIAQYLTWQRDSRICQSDSLGGVVPAPHRLALQRQERKTRLSRGRLPLPVSVDTVHLSPGRRSGIIGAESSRRAKDHSLSFGQIE